MPTNNAALYKIGSGDATVYNPAPVIQDFNQLLAQKQAQRQQEIKQLTDQQAQLKPDGLRNDADRQDFFNQVNDWRQKSINAMNEKDPYKKSLAQSQAQQAFMQAQSTVAQSKQQDAVDRQMNGLMADPTKRHLYTPQAVQQYLDNLKLGVNDPRIIKNYSSLQAAPDFDYFDKTIKGHNDQLLNNAQQQYSLGKPLQVGNQTQTPWTLTQNIKPEDLAAHIATSAQADDRIANALQSKYPDIFKGADTPEQYHMAQNLAALQEAKSRELQKSVGHGLVGDKETDDDKFNLHARMRLFDQKHPIKGDQASQLTPAQILIAGNPAQGQTGMLQGNTDAMKRIISLTPKGQYGANKISDPIIDPQTGEHVFSFPAQVKADEKAIKANADLRKHYADKHQPGFWNKVTGTSPTPFEQSDAFKKLQPETKIVKPAQEYRLNPADPQGYVSQASQMATDQNIKLPQLNQILGGKGGRGMIEPQKGSPKVTKNNPLGLDL